MRYAIVGHGKMGRAVDAAAAARGHVRAALVDRRSRSIRGLRFTRVDVAFEFTAASSAQDNVLALLEKGVSVVCGTTGWEAEDGAIRKAARAARRGVIVAPNFSVGMNLFYALVEGASRGFAAAGYDSWIAEWHHKAKRDAPSGTAHRLAALLGEGVPVGAIRAGHEPGRHVVGFDGPHDTVVLTHAARGREGFAAGAVLAAEWLQGKTGVHGFDEVLDDLVRKSRGGRR